MAKKTIEDVDVKGKRVLVRCDFNVPMNESGEITDDTRIVAALPTLRYLTEHGAKTIIVTHLGRPKGKVDMKYSVSPVGAYLADLMPETTIWMADDIVGESAKSSVADMKDGEIVLLENVRFDPREEKNDPEFAKELAELCDLYVSDAFGTVHRAHASTAGVAAYRPAVAGYLIGKELSVIGKALEAPERPLVAILGGAKVKDKIGVITNLLNKCDTLLIGGGMAYTFLKAKGLEIGTSLLDEENIGLASGLMKSAEEKGVRMLLPVDTVVADSFAADAPHEVVPSDAIPKDRMGMDIGPETAKIYGGIIREAGTVIWNGPMGVFEFPAFAHGTEEVAKACADCAGVTIIGGGDSASAVKKLGYADRMTHISTGGGATLEYLEGKVLPGIACLNDKE